jgi:predicted RNA-binding Zn-ribbon protein involved in translation (DUF1610 family)
MAETPTADSTPLLHLYLKDRDVPCPSCGYNLRDLATVNCPECGEHLVLRVNVAEPRQAAAIAGLITLMLGAGMNGMLLLYAAAMIVWNSMPGMWLNRFVLVNAGGFVVLGTAVFLWVKFWSHIRRIEAYRRWLLVFACALAALSDLIIFIKFID